MKEKFKITNELKIVYKYSLISCRNRRFKLMNIILLNIAECDRKQVFKKPQVLICLLANRCHYRYESTRKCENIIYLNITNTWIRSKSLMKMLQQNVNWQSILRSHKMGQTQYWNWEHIFLSEINREVNKCA